MKSKLYILFSFLFICVTLAAQDKPPVKATEDIEGEVKVFQDEAIRSLIGVPANNSQNNNTSEGGNATSTQQNGSNVTKGNLPVEESHRGNYRILVFSGNEKRSKNEAFSRKNLVKGKFSDMSVDVTFESPMWRVRAGHYTNRADADAALYVLKNSFPSFGREMYVVRVASK